MFQLALDILVVGGVLILMVADGALEKKLEAYVQTQKVWADAFANAKNAVVPEIMMGQGGAAGGNNAAMNLMEIMAVKAARDLQLDLKPKP